MLKIEFLRIEDSGSQAADSNGGAETASETDATTPNSSETSPPDRLAEVHQTLEGLQELFEKQISNGQQLFDALYEEMAGYKNNFMLEEFKTVIRPLLPVYDSFVALESQLGDILDAQEEVRSGKLTDFQQNLANTRIQLLEALRRLDVHPYQGSREKYDPKLQEAIEVIEADTAEKDFEIKTVHRSGFYWRDEEFRPEQVTIYRYNSPKTEEGKETNG